MKYLSNLVGIPGEKDDLLVNLMNVKFFWVALHPWSFRLRVTNQTIHYVSYLKQHLIHAFPQNALIFFIAFPQ